MLGGEGEEATLQELDYFLQGATVIETAVILVSDEVGLGVVPESEAGRSFRDVLGRANQRAAASAEEVRLCVAGIGMRVK
jgi:adenosylcobinamide kinase/adenosylcobinamide-phosphate guanylyltransferase